MKPASNCSQSWKARGFAALSGLLLAAAFPPLGWWPLALVALVPLFLTVWSGGETRTAKSRAWRGFRLGWIFGAVFFFSTMWWLSHVTAPGMIALCLYLALYPAVAMAISGWLGAPGRGLWRSLGHALLVGFAWAGLEWIRSWALSGFGWNGPAVPLFPLPGAAKLAAFTGINGMTAVPVAFSALLAAAIARRAWCLACAPAGLLAALVFVPRPFDGPRAMTGLLVQPNVPMDVKMSPDPDVQRQRWAILDQTDAAIAAGPPPDLVVWPESAIPGFFHSPEYTDVFASILDQGNFTFVTGADVKNWELNNSFAALRGNPDNFALHGKVRLVPFGEFIPFRHELPFLEDMLGDLIPLDFVPGRSLEPIRLAGQPFDIVPLVCFEDTIGEHARKFVRPGPQVLVNITNDNWFHESPGAETHFVNARWRAVELRRPLLRSANTGVSAAVHPDGTVTDQVPVFTEGTARAAFGSGNGELTFYAAQGDLVSKTGGLASLLAVAWLAWKRRAMK